MLGTLRAWLNGNREYYTGVILYAKVGSNTALLNLLEKGATPYTEQRLQEELLSIFNNLKSKEDVTPIPVETNPGNSVNLTNRPEGSLQERPISGGVQPNPELYEVCKNLADKSYKEVMNLRAELFALARADDYTDPNTPDKIQSREKLAIKVVLGFQKVSQLYDRADYVKEQGRLPDHEEEEEESDYEALPDHLVKQTLDNLRKNVNKMKKREQTPERLALLQKHESNIEKLKKRWLLLKPDKSQS